MGELKFQIQYAPRRRRAAKPVPGAVLLIIGSLAAILGVVVLVPAVPRLWSGAGPDYLGGYVVLVILGACSLAVAAGLFVTGWRFVRGVEVGDPAETRIAAPRARGR